MNNSRLNGLMDFVLKHSMRLVDEEKFETTSHSFMQTNNKCSESSVRDKKKFDKQDNNIMWNIFVIMRSTQHTRVGKLNRKVFLCFARSFTYFFYSTIISVRGIFSCCVSTKPLMALQSSAAFCSSALLPAIIKHKALEFRRRWEYKAVSKASPALHFLI